MTRMFSDALLRSLAVPGAGRTEIWDQRTPGFGLRVSSTGTKTFILVYRHRGRPRRLTLGRYPYMRLVEARTAANSALHKLTSGVDPAIADEDADSCNFQFDRVVSEFIEKHSKVNTKAKSWVEAERLLKKHFVSEWTKRDVRDITQRHVTEILDELVKKGSPSTANHALVALKTLLNWCLDRNLLAVNPCARLRRPARVKSRARVLSTDELKSIWASFDTYGFPFGVMGKLLLLTGQRRGDVTEMRWEHLNLSDGVWSIPPELTKNGQEHHVPLPRLARQILQGLPRLNADRVFPARGNPEKSVSGFSKAKKHLDKLSSTKGWTYHDLRRTVSTGMGELGVPPHVIERVLNHVSGQLGGVAGVYNRYQYLPEMRQAIDKWNDHVSNLTARHP